MNKFKDNKINLSINRIKKVFWMKIKKYIKNTQYKK